MAATAEFPFASPFPTGFGFRPTEEELITYYLKNKNVGNESVVSFIKEIDLYKFEPEQLPDKSFFPSDNFEWFFFRANTSDTKRTTTTGYWKSTGKPRPIKARGTNEVIASRQIFVFHRGKGGNAIKTNWVIHEYKPHPDTKIPSQHPFLVFRLKENAEDGQSSTVASHRTKKVTQGGEIREMNRDEQLSECEPLGSCTQQPIDAYDDGVEVNTQQQIQPGAGASEDENFTQILKWIFDPEGSLDDDATSTICRSPLRSEPEPEPVLTDFQPSNGNRGEVNKRSSESEFDEYKQWMNSEVKDKNLDEMTPNNHFNRRYTKRRHVRTDKLQSGHIVLQSGRDPDTNNTYRLVVVAVALLAIVVAVMFAKMWC